MYVNILHGDKKLNWMNYMPSQFLFTTRWDLCLLQYNLEHVFIKINEYSEFPDIQWRVAIWVLAFIDSLRSCKPRICSISQSTIRVNICGRRPGYIMKYNIGEVNGPLYVFSFNDLALLHLVLNYKDLATTWRSINHAPFHPAVSILKYGRFDDVMLNWN